MFVRFGTDFDRPFGMVYSHYPIGNGVSNVCHFTTVRVRTVFARTIVVVHTSRYNSGSNTNPAYYLINDDEKPHLPVVHDRDYAIHNHVVSGSNGIGS